jgi:predicted transcriptional regulator of viral defense system
MKLEDRLLRSVKKRAGNIVLRSEIAALGSPSQVSVALKGLQQRGVLVRIGTGVYAKTRISSVTGAVIPAGSLETLAQEALERLGVPVSPGATAVEYNAGRSTQLPGKLVVNTGRRRIRRNIAVGGRHLLYENNYGRATANA